MANLVAQMKEHLLTGCGVMSSHSKKTSSAIPSDIPSGVLDFTLDCSVQRLKSPGNAGLSSRVSYYFPSRVPASLNDVFRYVDKLNSLLQHSKVFVVQDLDGDHSYYLRMDTVLIGSIKAESISTLLEAVTQDVDVLLRYFRYNIPNQLATQGDIIQDSSHSTLHRCG